jgi:hypothetical protein
MGELFIIRSGQYLPVIRLRTAWSLVFNGLLWGIHMCFQSELSQQIGNLLHLGITVISRVRTRKLSSIGNAMKRSAGEKKKNNLLSVPDSSVMRS